MRARGAGGSSRDQRPRANNEYERGGQGRPLVLVQRALLLLLLRVLRVLLLWARLLVVRVPLSVPLLAAVD